MVKEKTLISREEKIIKMTKDKINEIWKNIKTASIDDLSITLSKLSVLMSNIIEIMPDVERTYINKQNEIMDAENLSVAKSELRAKATNEYVAYKKIRGVEKALIETIRALKMRIRVLGHDFEGSRNY